MTRRDMAANMIQQGEQGFGCLAVMPRKTLARLVSTYAPVGEKARADFWAELKALADERFPCEY